MSLTEDANVGSMPLSTIKEDYLTREIVLTHDPDDRWLDSHLLLSLVENIFCCTTENVSDAEFDTIGIGEIDLIGLEEPISLIIYKISNEILSQCLEDENLHKKTLFLLEMLGHYRWDAKLVLALASFAANFGVFWLIFLLQSNNKLAFSLSIVKQLPREIGMLRPKFKALSSLINTMVNLTKLVIRFEEMSMYHEFVENNAMDITTSTIYVATYWIFRSILVCSSQIGDVRNLRLEQVYSDKTVVEAWGLLSLRKKLNSLCHDLAEYVDKCQLQIETRLYEQLLRMFKDVKQIDNQNALRTLLASEHEFPLKNPSSGEKCGILDLKSKVVILLISKPELLPMEKLFFLVNQTTAEGGNYAIVWFPIPSITREWSVSDKTSFEFLSTRLPWFSIRRPWSINSTVINYIKKEWDFKEFEDPMMVVLNENGVVTNSNAMDMVWIWGQKAYPFSTSREMELWEEQYWTLNLVTNGISPLLSELVNEGKKNICIYGSDNLDWIRELIAKTKEIKTAAGIQFETVYVGCKNSGEKVKAIIETIYQEKLSTSLTFDKVNLFWFRLETIKRSIGHHDQTTNYARILREVTELLDLKSDNGWAVIGTWSSDDVIKLDQEKLGKCLRNFSLWCGNVGEMGLVGAIRNAMEAPLGGGKCNHGELIPYEQGMIEKAVICASCRSPVEKFVVYKCEE